MADFDEDELLGDFDDDGVDAEAVREMRASKKGLIFVVDCGKDMLTMDESQTAEEEDEEESKGALDSCALQRAMEVIFLALKKRVITDSGSTNIVGLILYGTKQNKNDNGFENVVEYHNFGGIDVERIYDVKKIAKNPAMIVESFGGSEPPSTTDSPLDRALWLCNFCFSGAKLKPYDEQKVWLFTNNDSPDNGDSALKSKLTNRFQDLFQANQTVDVWPMVPQDKFDESKFFKETLDSGNKARTSSSDDDGEDYEAAANSIYWSDGLEREDLIDFVRQKDFPKRKLAPITLDFGNNFRIGLDLFPLLMAAPLPIAQKLDGQTQSVIRVTTQYNCKETLTTLTPDQIETFYEFGVDGRVFVRPEEVRTLKRFMEPATIKVVGFKHKDTVRPWYSVRSPYFVVPSETKLSGSTKAFNALLEVMSQNQWVLYAIGTLRTSEACKFMCLMPRKEKLREDGVVMDYPGFDVIILPWANDVRTITLGPTEDEKEWARMANVSLEPSEGMVEAAKKMINSMTLEPKETTGRFFPLQNPNLQKHYAALESVALRGAGHSEAAMEWDPEIDDETLPQQLGPSQEKHILNFLKNWGGAPEDQEALAIAEKKRKAAMAGSTSRSTTSRNGGPAPKRVKRESAKSETTADWRELAKDGKLSKLLVADLKAICTENNLSTSGKKADLVARLEDLIG